MDEEKTSMQHGTTWWQITTSSHEDNFSGCVWRGESTTNLQKMAVQFALEITGGRVAWLGMLLTDCPVGWTVLKGRRAQHTHKKIHLPVKAPPGEISFSPVAPLTNRSHCRAICVWAVISRLIWNQHISRVMTQNTYTGLDYTARKMITSDCFWIDCCWNRSYFHSARVKSLRSVILW